MKAQLQFFLLILFLLFYTSSSYGNNELPISTRLLSKSYNFVNKPFRVVIDAGHGGKDGGTTGKYHKEKDIALSIALKLGEKIKQNDTEVEIIYTRDDDTFIPLFERVNIANKAKADLFISIHCNATSKNSVKGSETFVMGLHRAEENLETAKRENSVILLESDYETNYDGYDPNSDIGHIILSTYQNTYLDQSIELASMIEESFGLKTSRGVKQAGFVVLRRATMPSVLVEVGFLSNREEEKRLASPQGQETITKALAQAFQKYMEAKQQQEEEKILAAEDQQPNTIKNTASSKVATLNASEKKNPLYTIQIGATTKKNNKAFQKAPALMVTKSDNLYKYYSGLFPSRDDALKAKEKLKKIGYKDSFIVVYQKEKTSYAQK